MAEARPELQWLARERYCLDRKSLSEVAGELDVAEKTLRDWASRGDWPAEREALAEAEARIRVNTVKCRAHVLQKLLDSGDGADLSRLAAAAADLERLHRAGTAGLAGPSVPSGPPGPEITLSCGPAHGLPASEAPKKRPRRTKTRDAAAQDAAMNEGQDLDPALSESAGSRAADSGSDQMEELEPEERIRLLELAVNRQLSHVLSRPVEDLSKRVKEIKAALDILESMKGGAVEKTISVSFED